MRNQWKYLTGILVLSLGLLMFTGGCDKLKKVQETEKITEHLTESEIPTETEPETQEDTELETNVAYTTQDKSVRITLPDSTWKVTQDVDEMRVFSGGTAMINIVHAADESQMRNVSSVARSREELETNLSNQYPGENAFKIESFENLSAGTLNTYEYVVSYNSTSMWAYAVTYGIIAEDQAYVVTGTVTDDNRTLLDAVIKSVESFTVLNNQAFSELTQPKQSQAGTANQGQPESGDQSEGQENKEVTGAASEELQSLTAYGTSAQLYASDDVNVRVEPSTESSENIMASLTKGDVVTVTGETSQWFQVNINGNTGYVSKQFLVSSPVSGGTSDTGGNNDSSSSSQTTGNSEQQDAEYSSAVDYGTSYTYYTTTGVYVRSGPSTDSDTVGGLDGGTAITVVGETANWFIVSVNGSKAYISKAYVSSTNPGSYTNGGNTGGDTSGGQNSGGDTSGGNTSGGGTSGGESTGGNTGGGTTGTPAGSISGTITSAGVNSLVIAGDDGKTYTVDTTDATFSTSNGIYSGLYVSVGVDSASESTGSLHATSVTGY